MVCSLHKIDIYYCFPQMQNKRLWCKNRKSMWNGLEQHVLGHKYHRLIDQFAKRLQQKKINEEDIQNDSNPNEKNENEDNIGELKQLRERVKKSTLQLKSLKQFNEFQKIKIFEIENRNRNFQKNEINQQKRIEQLQNLNKYLIEAISDTAKILRNYKNQLLSVYQNCQQFAKTIKKNGGKDINLLNFTNYLSKRIANFSEEAESSNIIKRLNTIVGSQRQKKQRFSLISHSFISSCQLQRQKEERERIIDQYRKMQRQKNVLESNSLNFCFIMNELQRKRAAVWRQINLTFDNQVYLLQNKKMRFRDLKNKKLIRSPQFECKNCQQYEEILHEIFLITKQCFKGIKNKFLSQFTQYQKQEIKQVDFMV